MNPVFIKAEIALRGLSFSDLARKLGTSPQQISRVVNGKRRTPGIRQAIAEAIDRPVSEVFPDAGSPAGRALDRQVSIAEQESPKPIKRPVETLETLRKIPAGATVRPVSLLGRVPAGAMTEAVEDRLATLRLPVRVPMGTAVYALLVEGDSMSPELVEGDVVVVSERMPRSGDLAVVQMTETYDATIKRIRYRGTRVILEPINPRYPKPSVARKKIARLHRVEAVFREFK